MAIMAEIIAIGTELLLGQIANTNGQWISQQLASRGIGVYYHQVVGDNEQRVLDVLKQAHQRSKLIIITGGLGPTEDDLTKEMVAQFVRKDLVEDQAILAKIKAYFEQSNRQITENNYKQAMVIEGATTIPNPYGTAPGLIVPYQSSHFILLPGVPSEMKHMMTESVLPFLETTYSLNEVIVSKMLRCIGIGESQLETYVKDLIEAQSNPTIAPLAADGEVALRLTAKAESAERANQLITEKEKEISARIGQYIYSSNDQSLNETIVELLKEKNETIAVAESLTGGKFSDALVSVPGASQVFKGSIVSYALEAKIEVLGIDQAIIEEYGTVSEQTAYQMAKQAKKKFNTTYGISFTGVAGPESVEGKPVGTVYLCLYQSDESYEVKLINYSNNREIIRQRTIKKGFELIYNNLTAGNF